MHILAVMVILINAQPGHAEPAEACSPAANYQRLLRCAVDNHPSLVVSRLGVDQAAKGETAAAQRPNPEVNSQTIIGGSRSGNYLAAELNFAHTFELGGKRAARVKLAQAESAIAKGGLAQTTEDVYLTTALALYRLRQIEEEKEASEDALGSFAHIRDQYRTRPRLNPEQRASLRIFELAEQDYRIRLTSLDAERNLRRREVEIATGLTRLVSGNLPPRRTTWPSLPRESRADANARFLTAASEVEKSTAEISRAVAEAWPDLKLGPTVYTQRQAGQGFQALGFNFSLPLPIYHRNGAGREFAALGADRAAHLQALAKLENEHEQAYLRERYEAAVKSLQSASNPQSILRKHEETESLFAQGFLNGTVVIEMHRQISDLVKTQNEQELAAIESLIRFHALAGRTPEDI